ncbi:unnamed protein product [Ilex paraguariensis]|uniref:Sodium/calcium exchanger membrane region domain-containing protein n=1 Tax=Ilex paraguariensis TaxID=185542 RepID=A0ABC8T9Q0_9AQUA
MTITIAILSEYIVASIKAASDSWGISVSFISIVLLPIVGNAAEHAGATIFAFKNKLDISLGVALGSGSQISMFVIPFSVVVAWIMGIPMDLDFSLLETGCVFFAVIITAFTLQDGTSHYMKGVVLCLSYTVIAACFFVQKFPPSKCISNNCPQLRSPFTIWNFGRLIGVNLEDMSYVGASSTSSTSNLFVDSMDFPFSKHWEYLRLLVTESSKDLVALKKKVNVLCIARVFLNKHLFLSFDKSGGKWHLEFWTQSVDAEKNAIKSFAAAIIIMNKTSHVFIGQNKHLFI